MKFKFGPIVFLSGILFMTLTSRLMFSPLLLRIEADLGISHARATTFFLLVSLGYSFSMLASGFVSRTLTHRYTIVLASLSTGVMLFFVAMSSTLIAMQIGMVLLGMGSGLYLASGMATLYDLVDPKNLGKTIGIHEIGPSLSFMAAPLLAQIFAPVLGWRGVLMLIAALCFALGALFALFGRGGRFRGETPSFGNLHLLFSQSSFLIILVFFCLVASASLGTYAILPTFLVTERGLTEGMSNLFVGLSRVSGPFMVFFTGWLIDRADVRRLFVVVFTALGLATLLLGFGHGALLVAAMVLQPLFTAAFFPAAFALLANVGPHRLRNVAVSLVIPFAYFFGGGAVPAFLGIMGERGAFGLGIALIGALMLVSLVLLLFLKFPDLRENNRSIQALRRSR